MNRCYSNLPFTTSHDDVIKWKHFPRYWPFVRGIHRSPVNSPHKGQWRGALMFSLIRVWINGWVNNLEAGDFRHHRAHYDVTVMYISIYHELVISSPDTSSTTDIAISILTDFRAKQRWNDPYRLSHLTEQICQILNYSIPYTRTTVIKALGISNLFWSSPFCDHRNYIYDGQPPAGENKDRPVPTPDSYH